MMDLLKLCLVIANTLGHVNSISFYLNSLSKQLRMKIRVLNITKRGPLKFRSYVPKMLIVGKVYVVVSVDLSFGAVEFITSVPTLIPMRTAMKLAIVALEGIVKVPFALM